MTMAKSTRASSIPLSVIPLAVARLIRNRGKKVYRISIVRTHYHHYNISVQTHSLPRKLTPGREPVPEISDDVERVA